jgi:hypothetical protein
MDAVLCLKIIAFIIIAAAILYITKDETHA